MIYAIIAAGQGSRLQSEGLNTPKPLTIINGEPLIDRLIRIFMSNQAEKIIIVINDQYLSVKHHLDKLIKRFSHCDIRYIIRNTPSSFHSFYELSPLLNHTNFCLTTVDTIFKEEEFTHFINAFQSTSYDGLMAVTDYVDDEKPLYVKVNNELDILEFLDAHSNERRIYVSGGIYALKSHILDILQPCIENGCIKMRNFQRELLKNKFRLNAFPFEKILDIDHVSDIKKAELFLNES